MTYLPASDGFLGLPESAGGGFRACVIPFPLEASVSWKGGTAAGPEAIIEASQQVELFDETRMREPCLDFELRTRVSDVVPSSIPAALDQLAATIQSELAEGFFPLTLGGEHSLTAGAVRPFVELHEDLVIVQLDAHADMRDGYEGEHFSHAAAMRRCLDHPNVSLISFGIRNISTEEIPFMQSMGERVNIFWAHNQQQWDLTKLATLINGRPVYLTVDVDGFDSSLMPATGTPEPGGLFWNDAINIIEAVAGCTTIVGADIVELAPGESLHACDFLAAKLGYRILSAACESSESRER